MSELSSHSQTRTGRPIVAVIWFTWMVVMWVAFFTLLLANQLDDIWRTLTQLPVVSEVVLWIAFLPWMLGTWVWTGTWPEWIRIGLVLCFAIGWTLVSIPRERTEEA